MFFRGNKAILTSLASFRASTRELGRSESQTNRTGFQLLLCCLTLYGYTTNMSVLDGTDLLRLVSANNLPSRLNNTNVAALASWNSRWRLLVANLQVSSFHLVTSKSPPKFANNFKPTK
ncbi:hypothetical protein PanWU01x14_346300 [Parasponia andersonii]|uniref:Uncharacterized protein n=1 Tax=Parasponia andersonii TaxID=3476 RepID=A0A2P5ACE4_PARAD|nr:hypothetical protein PanWU01x14_346300 [Parasponia andersonii]